MSATRVIYGAGGAGRSYLASARAAGDAEGVLAFVDGNPTLHGERIDGIEVVAPARLPDITCDQVVIASMWVKEILATLDALGIPRQRIHIPAKSSLKHGRPFEDPTTREIAHQAILAITEALEERGVIAYLDYGTLLGLARSGQILPWDDDVDLSLTDDAYDAVLADWGDLRSRLPKVAGARWQCRRLHDGRGNDQGLSIDLKPWRDGGPRPFDIFVMRRRSEGAFSMPTGAPGNVEIPRSHFLQATPLDLCDHRVYAPDAWDDYLTLLYGDWRTPRVGVGFDDYPGVDPRAFGDIDPRSIVAERIF